MFCVANSQAFVVGFPVPVPPESYVLGKVDCMSMPGLGIACREAVPFFGESKASIRLQSS